MKKFWKTVKVKKKSCNSYEILLDEIVLKTPMKKDLTILNSKIAEEIQKEWNQDTGILDTDAMIFYGITSTSIDKIINSRISYINDILSFIDTDLICYRAEEPNDLVQWQSKNWDPILLKVEKYIHNKIDVFTGIMPSKQNKVIKFAINQILTKFSDLEIIVLHRITKITGSVFLSLCILNDDIIREKAFELSHLDELWQAENWGYEEEASNNREKINFELNRTMYFLDCLRS